jgi:16S rRNA (uracil1498-N3)-methyltransferase
MQPRFYVPGRHARGDLLELPAEEAEHALRVLRLGPGAKVRIFDGAGREFSAVIAEAGRKGVEVEIGSALTAAAEARVAITLVQAVLKGDKMDDVIRDAVMLGVAAIQPVVTERTEISLVALHRGMRRDRWQRIAVASTKQCGRAVVPRIEQPALFDRSMIAPDYCYSVLCVERGLPAGGSAISALRKTAPPEARVIIGPEGGWTPNEVAKGASAAALVTLGDRTLRADAMALVALTALYTHWNEL